MALISIKYLDAGQNFRKPGKKKIATTRGGGQARLVTWRRGGSYQGRKNSVREKFLPEKFCWKKFCPNPYFAWEKNLSCLAGIGKKYLERREAP